MKTLKTTILTLTCILCSSFFAFADQKVPITYVQLPPVAQAFIETTFRGNKFDYGRQEKSGISSTFEVFLADGTKIEFDKKGKWEEVDCLKKAVPAALIPKPIAEYVRTNHDGQIIVKIEKTDRNGYEIKLSDDVEIEFSKKFKVLEVEK